MEGWVDLGYPATHWLGFELAILRSFWSWNHERSRVRRRTTTLLSQPMHKVYQSARTGGDGYAVRRHTPLILPNSAYVSASICCSICHNYSKYIQIFRPKIPLQVMGHRKRNALRVICSRTKLEEKSRDHGAWEKPLQDTVNIPRVWVKPVQVNINPYIETHTCTQNPTRINKNVVLVLYQSPHLSPALKVLLTVRVLPTSLTKSLTLTCHNLESLTRRCDRWWKVLAPFFHRTPRHPVTKPITH